MVRINITGNARAHRMAYGRGIVLVSEQEAKKLVGFGIAEIIEEETVETSDLGTTPIDVETAVSKPKVKRKRKRKK